MVSADRATRRRTPGRLVHLAEHQGGLLDDAGLLHLDEQVGALTGALAHAGEHRHAAVLGGDPVDHLLDEHGLAHAGAAEQADLAAGQVRGEQVDDLDAGREHLGLGLERVERRRLAVDVPPLGDAVEDSLPAVERLADDVPDVAQGDVAHRHADAAAGVAHRGAPGEAVGRLERDDPHPAVADLLGHLAGDQDLDAVEGDGHLHGGVDLGQRAAGELDVDHRAGDGDDAAVLEACGGAGALGVGVSVTVMRGSPGTGDRGAGRRAAGRVDQSKGWA